jgi:hypothetical protein
MKLQLPAMVVFLFLQPLASSSQRLRRTLSATAKKPASLAGFLYFSPTMSRLTAPFLSTAPLSRPPHSFS